MSTTSLEIENCSTCTTTALHSKAEMTFREESFVHQEAGKFFSVAKATVFRSFTLREVCEIHD
jgi:hypothetical protein